MRTTLLFRLPDSLLARKGIAMQQVALDSDGGKDKL
jgi:hypothetical protein